MLAKKLSSSPSEPSPVPFSPVPVLRSEAAQPARTHLMLVRTPKPTPRALAWAQRGHDVTFDASSLTVMLQLERLNLG